MTNLIDSLPSLNLLEGLNKPDLRLGFECENEMCPHYFNGCEGADCLGLLYTYCQNYGEGCSIKEEKDKRRLN